MDFALTQAQTQLQANIRTFCADFPDAYWRNIDRERSYPAALVEALTDQGYLSALIPADYGGLGLGVTEAALILHEINRSGGNAAACHGQMYIMGVLVRHGSPAQKAQWLPQIARGTVRLQAFSVTERDAGSDTTAITTTATREGGGWIVNGHKNWTSRIQHSDLLLLLARTGPRDPAIRGVGLSLFLVDLRDARAQNAIDVTPVRTMFTYETFEVTYRNLRLPADALVGQEGLGFRHVIDGWNAERILLAAEAIGDGYWFIDRAVAYARERVVFDRPLGANQGIQFPLARAHAALVAAELVQRQAAWLYDNGDRCGAEANTAKLLASEASWAAANACLDIHGGIGFVDAHDIERKFRETRLFQIAPVGNNLILSYLATNVLGLPRSY